MKRTFHSRLSAIEWIANYVEDEGQFELLREQLNFNFIYTGTYFLDMDKVLPEVNLLGDDRH